MVCLSSHTVPSNKSFCVINSRFLFWSSSIVSPHLFSCDLSHLLLVNVLGHLLHLNRSILLSVLLEIQYLAVLIWLFKLDILLNILSQ